MIRIGTRTSKLAMIQTELVKQKIQEHFPEEKIEIVPIITKGDIILHQPLASFGGKGVFTQEIEQQLLDKTIDIAVHSAKDVPMQLADGLCIGAVLEREDCRDVLVTRTGISAKELPVGSVIGTSSLRRELQIKAMNPFVEIRMLRGNVPTRLQKLKDGHYSGSGRLKAAAFREGRRLVLRIFFKGRLFTGSRTGHFSCGNPQRQLKRSHGLFK